MHTQRANGHKVISLDEVAKLKKPVCAFKGCPFHGIYKPILNLRHDKDTKPLKVELDIVVCGIHTRNVGPREYLSDAGWEILCNVIPANVPRPDRELTTLEFELAI